MNTNKILEQRVEELEKRIARIETALPSNGIALTVAKTKKLSPKEFLMTRELKRETQKALALGYYLEHIEGMENFNIVDLETVFRSAKERPPQNMNDTINKNIARGFLMETKEKKDSKKAWILTSTGENHVEEKLKKLN